MTDDKTEDITGIPVTADNTCNVEQMPVSELDTSFTSFEDILKHDNETERMSTGSSHSKNDSSVEMIYTSPALLMEYSESACMGGRQCAQDVHLKASQCAEGAKDKVDACMRDFFSPEQERARTIMMKNAMSTFRHCLNACHDTVDSLLLRFFEQPLQEVEVRKTLDQAGSISFNEDITIDSELTRLDIDESGRKLIRHLDESIKAKPTRRARLASKKEKGKRRKGSSKKIPEEDITSNHSSPLDPIFDLQSVPTTESDVESISRFKELLYESGGDTEHLQTDDEILNEVLGNKESRSEPDTSTSASMDELDRALRTDIEKLGRISGSTIPVVSIEHESKDILKISASSSTPVRGNRRYQTESQYVDISSTKSTKGFVMDATISTRSFPIGKTSIPTPIYLHNEIHATPAEDVIDLTMYDDGCDIPTSDTHFGTYIAGL